MVIKRVNLKNFRGFEDISVKFSPHFNVIIGDNGSGKTALINGLTVAMSSFFLGIDGVPSRSIHLNDIRLANYENSYEYQLPVEVISSGRIASQELEWSREVVSKGGATRRKNAQNIKKVAQSLQRQVRAGQHVDLPLIAYFPAGRMWEIPAKTSLVHQGSRLRGYEKAILPTANYKFLSEWFKTKELAALQHGKEMFELNVVRRAVRHCIEECENIYYDMTTDALVMKLTDGTILPFNCLSDGFKNMMAIVSDIAYRCVTLNPHLRQNALLSSGVVLIDEVDLHLHPSWQTRIVGNLASTFPHIQFIVTTHSALILRALTETDKIIKLQDNTINYISHTYGRDVDDLLRYAMDTTIKNQDLEDYIELIEMGRGASDEAAQLRAKIERLSGPDYHKLAEADALLAFYE